MIANCGLLEFPSLGNTLSWRGRRAGHEVKCRLDRALANNEWHEIFPRSYVEYLPMVGSDHRPIVAVIEEKYIKFTKQFRFDKRWIVTDGLMEAISRGWKLHRRGQELKNLDRIHNFWHAISAWRKENPPYGKDRINNLQKHLKRSIMIFQNPRRKLWRLHGV